LIGGPPRKSNPLGLKYGYDENETLVIKEAKAKSISPKQALANGFSNGGVQTSVSNGNGVSQTNGIHNGVSH